MKQVLFYSKLSPFVSGAQADRIPAVGTSATGRLASGHLESGNPESGDLHSGPLDSALPDPAAPCPAADFLARIQAARTRHSACGVSCLLVRQGNLLLGALEGALTYVDRMFAALSADGLLQEPLVLQQRDIHDREYSQLALRLVELEPSAPAPAWASRGLATLDLRTARRALKSHRAAHGLHTEPARASHLLRYSK